MRTESNFWKGMAIGLVLLFGGMHLLQGCSNAHAMQGVDNQGKFTLAVGSSEPNRYDMLWVLHEHPPHPKLKARGEEDAGFMKGTQISLGLYKIEKQGEKMKLVAMRDIAYDIEYQDLNQEPPTVKQVYKHLQERK
jgi:hypothetical protein